MSKINNFIKQYWKIISGVIVFFLFLIEDFIKEKFEFVGRLVGIPSSLTLFVILIVVLFVILIIFFWKSNKKKSNIKKEGNHIILIGLSQKNEYRLKELLESDKNKILLVEKKRDKRNINIYKKNKNIGIEYADALDIDILKELNLDNAKEIYISTGNNELNDEIEDEILKLSLNTKNFKEEKELPQNIEKIMNRKLYGSVYKKYLSNENIEFISRIKFKNEMTEENDDNFKTEDELFSKLFNTAIKGLIIKGEGGVGKTRLMLELGERANREGWVTLQVLKDFSSWENLNEYMDKNKKYCLIFDNLVESKVFSKSILESIKIEHRKDIKIIANARYTYEEDSPEGFFEYLMEGKGTELKYLDFVVKNIIEEKIGINNDKLKKLQAIFKIPSMAIFLLESDNINNIEFKNINSASDFIIESMETTFLKNKLRDIPKEVFYFLASLPITKKSISENSYEIIESLNNDGWIELEEKQYKSKYNDTIIDTVLSKYFSKYLTPKSDFNRECIKFFDYANNHLKQDTNYFSNVFHSLERISDDLKNQNINYAEVFEDYSKEIEELGELLAKSPLVPRLQRIKLMENQDHISEMDFGLTLSRIMANNEEYEEKDRRYIIDIFEKWISNPKNLEMYGESRSGSFLINSYYEFFSKDDNYLDINKYAEKYLHTFNEHRTFIYVLEGYVKENGYSILFDNDVKIFVKKMLDNNILSNQSIKFLKTVKYLDVLVREEFKVWIQNNIVATNFTSAVKMYLDMNGEFKFIEDSLSLWLNENTERKSFSQAVIRYLDMNGEFKFIEDSLSLWLNENTEHKSFSRIAQDYLNKDGTFSDIEKSMAQWINLNIESRQFSYILSPYLTNRGDIEEIEMTLNRWLDECPNKYTVKKISESAIELGFKKKSLSNNCIFKLHADKDRENVNIENIKKCLDYEKLNLKNFKQYTRLLKILLKEKEENNGHLKKMDIFIKELCNSKEFTYKQFEVYKSYLKIIKNHDKESIVIDDNVKSIGVEFINYINSNISNEFHTNVLKNYLKIKNDYGFSLQPNLLKLEDLIKNNISFTHHCMEHQDASIDKKQEYFKVYLEKCIVSETQMGNNILKTFKIYFQTIPSTQILEDEIYRFIDKNMKIKKLANIIMLLISVKFNFLMIEKLLHKYMDKHPTKRKFLLEEMDKLKNNTNNFVLNKFQEIIKNEK